MNIEKIQAAISKYSFSAELQGNVVLIKNKKGQLAARVQDGKVERLFAGNQALCGALVRNDIVAALNS
jgi:hypothetical protein